MHDLIELHLPLGAKLESLWQFYISVHLAIIGGIFLLPTFLDVNVRRWARYATIAALWLAYSGFMWVNGKGMHKTYTFMHASQTDMRTLKCTPPHEMLCKAMLVSDLPALQTRAVRIYFTSWLLVTFGLIGATVVVYRDERRGKSKAADAPATGPPPVRESNGSGRRSRRR